MVSGLALGRLARIALLSLLLPLTGLVGRAAAQSTTGSFIGTVVDPTGAALPGVTVTLTNTSTGLVRSTVTNTSGNYDATLLPPGTYNVTAELSGFQKTQKTGLVLQVNQSTRVDFKLQLSGVQESVMVTAESPVVDTQDTSVKQVVGETQIVSLPLNGRNFKDLGLIVPGVQDMAQNSNLSSRGGGLNIVGAQDTQNNFLLDGFDNNDPTTGETLTFPSVDSLQEFTIMGSAYGADIGFSNGGIVSLVTKSGSSQYKGDAFEFLRNSRFDATNYFANQKPPLNRNQFGATLGGPVGKVPHLFFFGAYESTVDHEGVTQTGTVATSLMRSGNFSEISKAIVDPLTGQPFPGNQIPASRMNPIGLAMLTQLFPAPNAGGLSRNYVTSPIAPNDLQVGTGRLDYTPNASNTFFLRYSHNWQTSLDTTLSPFVLAATSTIKHNYDLGGEWTHVFGPNTVQEARFAYGHVDNEKWPNDRQNWDQTLGIPGPTHATTAPTFLAMGPPVVNVTGYSNLSPFTNPFIRTHRLLQGAYTLTHNRGDHSIRVGAEYRHFSMDVPDSNTPEGSFSFTGQYSGNAIADLLLGYPAQTVNVVGPQETSEFSWQLAGYAEDNWRVSQRLTLNYGLRYEYQEPDTSSGNTAGAFVPALGQAVFAGTNGVLPGIRAPYYKDFAPRVGAIWDPTGEGRMTLRANYGIYYESLIHSILQPVGLISWPVSAQGVFTGSRTSPNITLNDPFPAALAGSLHAASGMDPSFHGGRTQRWDVGVQQAIGSRGSVDVSYVGSTSNGLEMQYNLNQPTPAPGAVQPRRPYPNFSNITWITPNGTASYKALQAKYDQRLSKGFSMLLSYTLSKTLDNTQDGVPIQNPLDYGADLGLASYDRRHRFVASLTYLSQAGNRLLRDWQLATISTFTSGMPLTPLLSLDSANVGSLNLVRPNVNGDPNANAPHSVNEWFDTSVFSLPAPYTYGNAGRSIIEGPGFQSVNVTVSRLFPFGTRDLEVRVECFNLLNHANFMLPNSIVNSPDFGKIFAAGDPREMQFGVKFRF